MKFCSVINFKTSGKVTQIDAILNVQDRSISIVQTIVYLQLSFYSNPTLHIAVLRVRGSVQFR